MSHIIRYSSVPSIVPLPTARGKADFSELRFCPECSKRNEHNGWVRFVTGYNAIIGCNSMYCIECDTPTQADPNTAAPVGFKLKPKRKSKSRVKKAKAKTVSRTTRRQ